jgi:hypothetical protein
VHWGVQGLRYYEGEENSFSGIPLDMIERFADAFFMPYAFLLVGSYIAPRFKLITCIVLLVTSTGGLCLFAATAYASGRYYIEGWFSMTLRAVLWIVAGCVASVQAHEADKEIADRLDVA